MRNVVDQYIKDALCTLLTPVKKVEKEKEVRPEAQRIDLYVAPAPEPGTPRCPLGLLGRLLERPCNLEHFHAPPTTAKLLSCLRKHLNSRHVLSLEDPPPAPPTGWVLSAGRATLAMADLGCRRARGWTRGIYAAAPALRFGVVVLTELKETRDTLLLRLLATGATLQRAMAELKRLPPDAPEVTVMVLIMLRSRLMVPAEPSEQTEEEKEFLMRTQDAIDMWNQQRQSGVEAGRKEGLEIGLEAGRHTLLALYEVRFGPAPAAVRTRVAALADPEVLKRWSDLVARGARDEIDRVLGGA